MSTVLLLTHSKDVFTVDRVADALVRRGARPIRLDTDRFPAALHMSRQLGQHPHAEAGGLDLSEVAAVWYRRLWTPDLDADLDAEYRQHCLRESIAARWTLLDALHDRRWVNALDAQAAVEANKLGQLRVAQQVGLTIPDTLVTNDPAQLQDFFARHDQVVAKLLAPVATGMGPASAHVYTSVVRLEDLEDTDGLRHSPMVFQARIPKQIELRLVWVAGRIYVGGIQADEDGAVDWKRSDPSHTRWVDATVPDALHAPLAALMDRLGLEFGAIDLIRRPDGTHVFLEVNPGGEWGMLERDLGLPISEGIADALLEAQ